MRKKKQLQKIRDNWGKPIDDYRNFYLIDRFAKLQVAPSFHTLSPQTLADIDFNSLFEYLDRTTTKPGQQYLYNKLIHPTNNVQALKTFDKQVDFFAQDARLRENIQLQMTPLSNHSAYYLSSLLQENVYQKPSWAFLLTVDAVIVVLMVLFSFKFPVLLIWLLIPLTINILLHLWNKNKANDFVRSLPQLNNLINISKKLCKEAIPFDTAPIQKSASVFQSFQRRLLLLGMSQTPVLDEMKMAALFIFELFKALFLLEVRAFFSCMDDISQKREQIILLFSFVGSVDAAISTASVRAGAKYCKPVFTASDKALNTLHIYHPLIENCTTNSIAIKDKSILITGSNMSGKTTFIRTVAINSILAQSIYTCFAESFTSLVLKVASSIKIEDNLLEQTSYYLQEVTTIHELINASAQQAQYLFVIDEVFKGTNTVERVAAGKAVLSYLNKKNNLVIVSTHDIELSDLLKEEYDLYHFEEQIINDALTFDHLLKPGKLKTRNAIKLLELSGYPREVVEEARMITGYPNGSLGDKLPNAE
ncbi:MutS-related protein [Chitinophagaceae bacterium LWZ2-11]